MRREVFGFLTEADWQLLLNNARHVSYRKGDVIVQEGAQVRAIFWLDQGYVSVESSLGGTGIRLNQMGPGEIFGELSFIDRSVTTASVIAEEEAEVSILDEAQIVSLLETVPGFATRFYQSLALVLAQRLRKLSASVVTEQSTAIEALEANRIPRTGNISELQVPQPLTATLSHFRHSLSQIEEQLQQRQLSDQEGQEQVAETCDQLFANFAQAVEDEALINCGWDDLLSFRDTTQLESGIGDYVFREAFPLLMRSTTIATCQTSGGTFANDYRINNVIDAYDPSGDGRLGVYIDAWFLNRPFCRLRRQRRELLAQFIQAANPDPLSLFRVTSLAGGNGQELFELLQAANLTTYATALDISLEALAFMARRRQTLSVSDRLNVLRGDLQAIVTDRESLALPPQQLIFGWEICDRWADEQVVALLNWAFNHLTVDGMLLLSNLHPDFPDRLLFDHVLNWGHHYRTETDWQNLLRQSRFQPAGTRVQTDESGALLLISANKVSR